MAGEQHGMCELAFRVAVFWIVMPCRLVDGGISISDKHAASIFRLKRMK
jgi:hypothetical protein